MAYSNENHNISLTEAAAMTKRYRDSIETGDIIAHYFGKQAIEAILAQQGAEGVRIYYGLDEENVKQIIAVGVNSSGNDLYNGLLAERTIKCPMQCSLPNQLNSDVSS